MPAPANDECAGAIEITSLPYNSGAIDVTDASHGPNGTCEDFEHTIWFKWTAPNGNQHKFTFSDNRDWGALLAIYTGSCGSLTEIECNDDLSSPETIHLFTPTNGVTYYILVGIYPGVLGIYPSVELTLELEQVGVPATPTISAASTTARTVTVTWGVLADTAATVHFERKIAGVWTEITTRSGTTTNYIDRGLIGGTAYEHRIRLKKDGAFGSYSNVTTTTTQLSPVGIRQHAFSVKLVGSFCRPATQYYTTPGQNDVPPIFELTNVLSIYPEINPVASQPGGPGTSIYYSYNLVVYYIHNGVTVRAHTTGHELELDVQRIDGSGINQILIYHPDNTIEIRGRCGSYDTATLTHRADGWFEVKYNGAVIMRVENVTLAAQGQAGWTNVQVAPTAGFDHIYSGSIPPGFIHENGGLISFQMAAYDQYNPATTFNLFNYEDFDDYSDSDLFTYAGGSTWIGRNWTGVTSHNVPTLLDVDGGTTGVQKLSEFVPSTVLRGYMVLASPSLPTPPFGETPYDTPPLDTPPYGPPGIDPDGEVYNFGDNPSGGGGGGTGTILVKKVVIGATGSEGVVFDYTLTTTIAQAGTISNGETDTFNNVPVGAGYSLSETPKDNWSTSYSVSPSSAGNVNAFAVALGQTVTITITNTLIPTGIKGIYVIEPNKTNDTLWVDDDFDDTVNVKIPDPFVKGFLLGD